MAFLQDGFRRHRNWPNHKGARQPHLRGVRRPRSNQGYGLGNTWIPCASTQLIDTRTSWRYPVVLTTGLKEDSRRVGEQIKEIGAGDARRRRAGSAYAWERFRLVSSNQTVGATSWAG